MITDILTIDMLLGKMLGGINTIKKDYQCRL